MLFLLEQSWLLAILIILAGLALTSLFPRAVTAAHCVTFSLQPSKRPDVRVTSTQLILVFIVTLMGLGILSSLVEHPSSLYDMILKIAPWLPQELDAVIAARILGTLATFVVLGGARYTVNRAFYVFPSGPTDFHAFGTGIIDETTTNISIVTRTQPDETLIAKFVYDCVTSADASHYHVLSHLVASGLVTPSSGAWFVKTPSFFRPAL